MQKLHTSDLFCFLYKEKIEIVSIILNLEIENFEMHLTNSNHLSQKSRIFLTIGSKKRKLIRKQRLHYTTNKKSLFYEIICLSIENLSQKFSFGSRLNSINPERKVYQISI